MIAHPYTEGRSSRACTFPGCTDVYDLDGTHLDERPASVEVVQALLESENDVDRLRADRDAAEARAETAETDLASACSEIARWGERATTAETALAAAREAVIERHRQYPNEIGLGTYNLLRRLLDVPDQPNPPAEPLLRAIYESWKADGHKVTMETGDDGKPRIRIHPPGEWRPFDVPDQPNPPRPPTPKETGETSPPKPARRETPHPQRHTMTREPQPTDGPDYHAEHTAWEARQPVPVAPTTRRWEVDESYGRITHLHPDGSVNLWRSDMAEEMWEALVALVRERDRVTATPEPTADAVYGKAFDMGAEACSHYRLESDALLAARAALVAEAREDGTDDR